MDGNRIHLHDKDNLLIIQVRGLDEVYVLVCYSQDRTAAETRLAYQKIHSIVAALARTSRQMQAALP